MRPTEQRIKGAIDRSIAEEQARQKALNAPKDGDSSTSSRRSGSVSRSSSTRGAGSPAKRSRAKKPSQDVNGDGASNPDPAVFEAAFVIDDTDEGTPSATPKPEDADKQLEEPKGDRMPAKQVSDDDKTLRDGQRNGENGDAEKPPPQESKAQPAASPELSPEIRTKLKKLDKLEKTYSGSSHPICLSPKFPPDLTSFPSARTFTLLPNRPWACDFHRTIRKGTAGKHATDLDSRPQCACRVSEPAQSQIRYGYGRAQAPVYREGYV
jgi:hypothetical protein